MIQTALGEGGAKASIASWAFAVGLQVSRRRQQGLEPVGLLKLQYAIADALVFKKIRGRLGGNIRYLVSGSAALSGEVAEWFEAAGLLILEGYGLTETSAGTCLNRPHNWHFGTVGEPFPGSEIRIAADGEIQVRGPGVMRGYHGMADQTAAVLDADGWFSTGDVGEIDRRGSGPHHRPEEGPGQDVGRQVHRAVGHRSTTEGVEPDRRPCRRPCRQTQLRQRAHHPRPRHRTSVGRERRHHG